MSELLSIVIPTKNRYQYLKGLISNFKSFDNEYIELVLQDNSDDNTEVLEHLKDYSDLNIKYYYEKGSLSMSENSDLAIRNARGKYICFIGDDDGVSTRIIDIARYMDKEGIESCICENASFLWPDVTYKYHKFAGLRFAGGKGKITEIDIKEELINCLKCGTYSMGNLPKVYHGIVQKEVLDKIYANLGTYFPGPSPDIANAIALCFELKNHIHVDFPYIISGVSKKSSAGMGARHKHKGNIKDISFLGQNTEKEWEKAIPKIWTGETIYAESAIKAIKAYGKTDCLNNFNWNCLYGTFLCFHPDSYGLVKPYINSAPKFVGVVPYFLSAGLLRLKVYISNFLETRFGISKILRYDNVLSITEATQIIDSFIAAQS